MGLEISQSKPRITWVTADYFVDCDFNVGVLSRILKVFNIHWIILLPVKDGRFKESDFDEIKKLNGIELEFRYWQTRARSPKMLLFYAGIYSRIKTLNADLVYINDVPVSPYMLLLFWQLDKKKTIFAAHDGNVKPSFRFPRMSKIMFNLAYRRVAYVNMFSKTEASSFNLNFKKAKIFIIPLALKDFGNSNSPKRTDNIVFLFFGSINTNKNLELLIDAACNLYDKGVNGFKIAIHGFCTNWDYYSSKIRYPELFECDIRLHDNSEIPVLFTQSHYAVFPYSDVSQSGAIKVAFNYGTPIIVSDLEAFKDEVRAGINGFIFKSQDVNDLENLIERLLKEPLNYDSLIKLCNAYNKSQYSNEALAAKYVDMFNRVGRK